MSELTFSKVTRIKVFGVGGAGCNAVNRMVEDGVAVGTYIHIQIFVIIEILIVKILATNTFVFC